MRKTLIVLLTSLFALSGCNFNPADRNCTHEDLNHDGICDKCKKDGLTVTHKDLDRNHICDVCNATLSVCKDSDNNHKCDLCGTVLSTCADLDKNHFCDICNTKMTECIDSDSNNYCDICNAFLGEVEIEPLFEGGIVDDGVHIGYEFSKKNPSRPTTGTGEVDIFGINDLHGAVTADDGVGLVKLGTYIKAQTSKENTLFIDSGDTWQGSLQSNFCYGTIIQDVFAYSGMSFRTVGNHDFDWGVERLIETNDHEYSNQSVPSLAANVYSFDWDTKTVGTTFQKNIGKEYATFVMDNGIKVGFVGVIGDDQITSITTQYVKNISFTNHSEKIKEISDYLRTTKNCDIVVASVHGSQEQTLGTGITSISPVSHKKYVDLVFNAHTHKNEYEYENEVLFTQYGSYGSYAGEVKLTYNFETGEISTKRESFNKKYINYYYPENDPQIESMVSNYLSSISEQSSQILSTKFSGNFENDQHLPNLMAKAIFEEAKKEGFNVDISIVNYARDAFSKSTMTYTDLYRSFPFDNEVIIFTASGENAVRTVTRNFSYHEDETLSLNESSTYTFACLDYLALHCNEQRNYNYFPNAIEIGSLKKNGEIYTYREILKDYLLTHPEESFASNDYSCSNWQYYFSY